MWNFFKNHPEVMVIVGAIMASFVVLTHATSRFSTTAIVFFCVAIALMLIGCWVAERQRIEAEKAFMDADDGAGSSTE